MRSEPVQWSSFRRNSESKRDFEAWESDNHPSESFLNLKPCFDFVMFNLGLTKDLSQGIVSSTFTVRERKEEV